MGRLNQCSVRRWSSGRPKEKSRRFAMTRKILTLAAVAAGLLALAPPVRADGPSWGVGFGIGFGGAGFSGFVGSPVHHRHVRPAVIVAPPPVVCAPRQIPIYRQVWVPA